MTQLALSEDFVSLINKQAKAGGYVSAEAYLRDLVDQDLFRSEYVETPHQVPDGYSEEAWRAIQARALGLEAPENPEDRRVWLDQALEDARASMERGERSDRTAEQIMDDVLGPA